MLSRISGRRRQDMRDYADVVVKPPILFAGAVLLGCLLSWIVPSGPGSARRTHAPLPPAARFALIGLALGRSFGAAVPAGGHERRSGRAVDGSCSKTGLTASRGTRSISASCILYFGLAIMLTSAWMLLLLIPVLIILQRGVVEREEAYLQAKFGEAYRKYQARVPRWL